MFGPRQGSNFHLLYARADLVEWRAKYLRAIHQYRKDKRRIVYLDETWFNSNDAPSRTWHDTNVMRNPYIVHAGSGLSYGVRVKSGRGQRLIIVNAIERSGPVPNALWVFCSNKPQPLADYHSEMDSHNFELWFKNTLLPNLMPNSVIVVDNAPYHSRKAVTCPSRGRRAEVIKLLQDNGCEAYDGQQAAV